MDLFLLPVANPDGFVYTHTSVSQLCDIPGFSKEIINIREVGYDSPSAVRGVTKESDRQKPSLLVQPILTRCKYPSFSKRI